MLSMNPSALDLLSKNLDKVHWPHLSINPSAVNILSHNIDKINMFNLLHNPNIFEIDYTAIRTRMNVYSEELMMHALHPSRIQKMIDNGYDIDDF